jgi:hypothetical protein
LRHCNLKFSSKPRLPRAIADTHRIWRFNEAAASTIEAAELLDTTVTAARISSLARDRASPAAWTDDEIKRALTHGVGRDGRAFKLPMARQAYYGKLTAADLDALVAWVRTIPPID